MTKVFMLTSFFLLALASCSDQQNRFSAKAVFSEKAVLEGPFIIKDGIKYNQISNKPITGIVHEILAEDEFRTIHRKGSYVDGKLEGPFEKYFDGVLAGKGFYQAGKQHGYFEVYHTSHSSTVRDVPQLWQRGNYKDGTLYGSYEVFHENGQLWMETTYPKGDVWSCFGPRGVEYPERNMVGGCAEWPDWH